MPILDFTHAVAYLFSASVACFGKTDEAWTAYAAWMRTAWQGNIAAVIDVLKVHQDRLGSPAQDADAQDPAEQLRRVIGCLENNRSRMRYDKYRRSGLPTTSAWMESAVKEMNYRIKGTGPPCGRCPFWNNPQGAEAILQIRSASLCDDDRLVRLLTKRPGQTHLRRPKSTQQAT